MHLNMLFVSYILILTLKKQIRVSASTQMTIFFDRILIGYEATPDIFVLPAVQIYENTK